MTKPAVRIIVQQFDPERPIAGGIDTCIRGLVRHSTGTQFWIIGVVADGRPFEPRWHDLTMDGTDIRFFPVAALDPSDQHRRIPHSARVTAGLLRYRPVVPVNSVVQCHRLDIHPACRLLYSDHDFVQLLHMDGHDAMGSASDSFWKHARSAYRRLEKWILPRCEDVVVFSGQGADRLKATLPTAPVRFSPTWFESERFRPRSDPKPGADLLWLGRVESQKAPLQIVEFLRCAPTSTVRVIGDGTLRSQLQIAALSAGVQDRLTLMGYQPQSVVADVLQEASCLLMTSEYEGFSRAVVEALASGVPVLTTPGGDPNRLIENGINGWRTFSNDPNELAMRLAAAERCLPPDCRASVERLAAATVVADVLRLP